MLSGHSPVIAYDVAIPKDITASKQKSSAFCKGISSAFKKGIVA
jgi:hypothetical protein